MKLTNNFKGGRKDRLSAKGWKKRGQKTLGFANEERNINKKKRGVRTPFGLKKNEDFQQTTSKNQNKHLGGRQKEKKEGEGQVGLDIVERKEKSRGQGGKTSRQSKKKKEGGEGNERESSGEKTKNTNENCKFLRWKGGGNPCPKGTRP